MNIKGHFETITRHKLLVMKYCFACGLYEQGLAHDLSKYSPTEFIPGCIYYQGDHSPNEAEREAKGYTSAWLHHKGRNKHHLEYWIDYSTTKAGLTGMKIPRPALRPNSSVSTTFTARRTSLTTPITIPV